MKKLIKDLNFSEIVFLVLGILVLLVISLITHSTLIVLCASILGFLVNFLSAKAKIISQFLGIIAIILFLIISLPQQYYGEVIIIIFITLPIKIKTIFSWLNNKDEQLQVVKANNIKENEWQLIWAATILVSIGFYFLLNYFNTKQLLISTFSAVTSIISAYLLMRRNKHSFSFAVINDIFRLILWLIPTIQSDWSLLTLVITRLIYLSVDLYGYFNWTRMEIKQSSFFKFY